MSVQITFKPEGRDGLVAEGTYISEAARRLGVVVSTDCKGRGECDSCAVIIVRGAELLSVATNAEEKVLGQDRLNNSVSPERLACQAILGRTGEVVVRLPPAKEEEPAGSGKTLRGLPLKEKVGALIELEAITVTEALNSLRGSYHSLVEKFLNLAPQPTKQRSPTTKESAGNDPGSAEKQE